MKDRAPEPRFLPILGECHISLEHLTSLQEEDGLAVGPPSCIAYAFPFRGKLDLFPEREASILGFPDFLEEQVPAGTVLLDGCVADSVENPFPVGRQPRV